MSRLIIKNLPKNANEAKLRSLFIQKGEVTDVQLKYTQDGKFRHFGFIGYKTTEDAQSAIEYFNNSFIGSNRISVQECVDLGDSSKPKSWSKYAADSNKNNTSEALKNNLKREKKSKTKAENNDDIKVLLEKHKDDPEFNEFMQVHLKTSKNSWSDDFKLGNDEKINLSQKVTTEAGGNRTESDSSSKEENEHDKLANKDISDFEYMKSLMKEDDSKGEFERKPRQKMEKTPKIKLDLHTVKIRGLSYNCHKKDIKHFFHPVVPYSIRIPRQVKGFAYIGFKTEKDFNKALLKDRSFICGKRISVTKYSKEGNITESQPNKMAKWKTQEETLKNEEDIAISGRIFVRNLTYATTEDDIQKLFEKYGPVTEVNLPIDKTSRQMKGFGTITFMLPEHATKAYCELDGTTLNGRMLHLLPAKAVEEPNQEDNENLNFKDKKELSQKKQATSSHNWNSLFVASDAVVNAVANTYGTTRKHVLGVESGQANTGTSAAVRLALGETQIVQDIKAFLETRGIRLDVFNKPNLKKSKTVILVKNLSNNITENAIATLFKPYGVLGRVILPPKGITAVVEFLEPSEAREAFRKLAYTKYENAPLYLEWAPEDTFSMSATVSGEKADTIPKEESPTENITTSDIQIVTLEHSVQTENVDENETPEENTVLFVKNLNFSTTDSVLRKHFEQCGKLKYATVATKKNTKIPGQLLSMGYGFVQFMYELDAENALKILQFSTLEGKTLELKRSERTSQTNDQLRKNKNTKKNPESTKILVRNIPFQANKHEVKDLFTVFGEIKALRLPKKMVASGDHHRGFGFVEFVTKADAKKAFASLSQSTHLYGRRLVLEWATTESEDINELRKRTAKHFTQNDHKPSSKKSVLDLELKENV